MNKKQFERAPFIFRQISKLSTPVTDVVQSSSTVFPWAVSYTHLTLPTIA